MWKCLNLCWCCRLGIETRKRVGLEMVDVRFFKLLFLSRAENWDCYVC